MLVNMRSMRRAREGYIIDVLLPIARTHKLCEETNNQEQYTRCPLEGCGCSERDQRVGRLVEETEQRRQQRHETTDDAEGAAVVLVIHDPLPILLLLLATGSDRPS